MKALLQSAGTGWGSFFYLIILMPIAGSATVRWPLVQEVVSGLLALF